MGWTDERVELLKKLWMEGFSASQIAAELGDGVTRNAVIGKVHRLKLSGRAKPASAAPRARTAPRSGAPRRTSSGTMGARSSLSASVMKHRSMGGAPMIGATALKISEDLEVEAYVAPQVQELFIPVEQRLSLLQLSEQTCKWPIGDPLLPEFYFCGQHSEDGKPYCDFHSRRAYHQVDKKKR
ncbi:MAG: GcrA family cell cycle regulator [Devosia sp.]